MLTALMEVSERVRVIGEMALILQVYDLAANRGIDEVSHVYDN